MEVINAKTAPAEAAPASAQTAAPRSGGYSPFAGAMYEQADPRRYVAIILSHWWIVLLIVLLGTAVGAAYCILSTPQYRAICRYEIYTEDRLQFSRQGYGPPSDAQARQRGRQVLIITGTNLRGLVNAKLQPKWQGVIPNLDAEVLVRPVREVETMMDISVDAVKGEYALDYLKELLNEYQEVQRTRSLESNENAMRSLWVEKQRLATEMEDAQNAMLKFQKEHNIRFSESKNKFDDEFLQGLIQRQNALRMERTMLETQFPFLEQANTATIQDVLQLTMETHAATTGGAPASVERPAVSGAAETGTGVTAAPKPGEESKSPGPLAPISAGWQQQEELVARLEAEYQDMLAVYKPSHPRMRELQRYIDAAKRELRFGAETALKRLKARLDATKIQEQALDKASRDWRSEISLSVAERATYDSLSAKVEHLKQLHDQVYARIIDGTSQNIDVTFNHMVEPPRILGIVWPNRLKIMTFSMLAALAAGLLLTFALDFLDTSMTDVMAIEERLGLQYLSSIPNWDRLIPNLDMKNAQVVVRRDKSSITSEVYRSLRSSLENIIGTKKGYALTITSTEANEGKSMTAINLAVAFSWTGKKVLLVDGDLRRGKLTAAFGITAKTGITEFLLGKIADWHDIVLPTTYENLALVPVGTYNHAAPELLDPGRVKQLVTDWGTEYDMIIFDTAPIGRVVDSARLARASDGVLLVTRHGHCTFAGVRHALHRLEGSTIIGFCLNGIEVTGRHLGYFHYYGYFRRFGRYGHYAYENYYDRYKYGKYGYAQYGYAAKKAKDAKDKDPANQDATATTEDAPPKDRDSV